MSMRLCPQCGYPIEKRFCNNCGYDRFVDLEWILDQMEKEAEELKNENKLPN